MPFKVTGLEETIKGIDREAGITRKALDSSLLVEGEMIMAEAQVEVPRATGFLANSKFVRTERGQGRSRVVLGFEADYAAEVHNNPRARHNSPTKWRYLADPIARAAKGFVERVAARARKMTR